MNNNEKYPFLGKITLNRVNGVTKDRLFNNNNLIENNFLELNISSAYLSKSSNSIYQDKKLYKINLSNIQWTDLLLGINNPNGIPCTLNNILDDNGNNKNLKYINENDNKTQKNLNNILLKFNEELEKLLPENKNILKNVRNILDETPHTVKTKNNLNTLLDKVSVEYLKNKDNFFNLINNYIMKISDLNDEKLEKDIKDNFFNFASAKEQNNIMKLLNLDIKPTLLEDKTNSNIKELQEACGVITLKEIKVDKNEFIADENSINGYQITLYTAKEEIQNNIKRIVPNKKLTECILSHKQFGDLIANMNAGGTTTRITYRNDIGEIKKDKNISFDPLLLELKKFNEYLDEIPNEINNTIKELNPLIKNKIPKKNIRPIEIQFEHISHILINNIEFYLSDLKNIYIKDSSYKKQDMQQTVKNMIKDLGINSFKENIKNQNINNNIIELKETKKDNNIIELKEEIPDI